MKVEAIVPMLTVADIPSAIAFYRDVLGFACTSEMAGWACLNRDGMEVMLALPNAHVPFDKPHFTGSLYFRVDDVEALWEQVRGAADIVYPLENFDYGMRELPCATTTDTCCNSDAKLILSRGQRTPPGYFLLRSNSPR